MRRSATLGLSPHLATISGTRVGTCPPRGDPVHQSRWLSMPSTSRASNSQLMCPLGVRPTPCPCGVRVCHPRGSPAHFELRSYPSQFLLRGRVPSLGQKREVCLHLPGSELQAPRSSRSAFCWVLEVGGLQQVGGSAPTGRRAGPAGGQCVWQRSE